MFTDISYPNFSDYLRYIPLLTPAIDEETYQRDYNLRDKRMIAVAIASFTILAATLLLAPKLIIFSSCLLLSGIFLLKLDDWLSARAANALAVNNYIAQPHPSEETFQHIIRNPQAVKWLINQDADLNKTTLSGKGFLNFSIIEQLDLNFFKTLVDHDFDWTAFTFSDIDKSLKLYSHFKSVVSCKNPDYLDYLLKHGQIQASDFSPEEQINCWTAVGNAQAVHLLVKHGFNINIQDSKGKTPLLELIRIASDRSSTIIHMLGDALDIHTHIRLLLENGADPYLSFSHGGVMKNAFQLNTDPEIAAILNGNPE